MSTGADRPHNYVDPMVMCTGRHEARVDGSYAVCRKCGWSEELHMLPHPAPKKKRKKRPADPGAPSDGVKAKSSRLRCFERDEYTCVYCGRFGWPLNPDTIMVPGNVYLTIDHIIPKSRGGAKGLSNSATSCVDCNHEKSDRTPAEWGDRWYHTGRAPKAVSWKAQQPRRETSPADVDGYSLHVEKGVDVSWPPKTVKPPPKPEPYVDMTPDAVEARQRIREHNARNNLATPAR